MGFNFILQLNAQMAKAKSAGFKAEIEGCLERSKLGNEILPIQDFD